MAIIPIVLGIIAVGVAIAALLTGLTDGKKDADQKFSNKPVGNAEEPCPVDKVALVEFVEVVQRSPEGVVVGAGPASGKLATSATRTEQSGAAYKQFVNLDKDNPVRILLAFNLTPSKRMKEETKTQYVPLWAQTLVWAFFVSLLALMGFSMNRRILVLKF